MKHKSDVHMSLVFSQQDTPYPDPHQDLVVFFYKIVMNMVLYHSKKYCVDL